MLRALRLNGLFLITLGLLSGCATVAPPAPSSEQRLSWAERQTILSRLSSWHLTGKIAVRTAQDAGSASVDWSEKQGRYTVSLMGPLGAGAMKLSGRPGHANIELANGERLSASSPEELLVRGWGFHLPVSYLNYWVRGLPAPGLEAKKTFDRDQRLTQLKQQQWLVNFLSYTNAGSIDLPSRIAISSPDLSTKIIIYDWKLN